MRKFLLLSVVLMLILVGAVSAQDEETFSLTLMHTNDTHSWHDPQGNGNGGAARQLAVINQIRAEVENSILLDAGDRFTGTLYHQQYRGEENAELMNMIGYDAMSLGNHEFDDGSETLVAFIDSVQFPVLAANVDASAVPMLDGLIEPYTVLDVNGEQIGVIGLVTAETVFSSSPDPAIVFREDYAAVVQPIVDELTAQGINKIFLVTHLGFLVDVDLASQITGVDVIVGGHSHSLLSNSFVGAVERYPFQATGADGQPIYVVQAGSQDVYLGRLDLVFDAAGVVTSATGDTILLSRYITPDDTITARLEELSEPFVALRETIVGESAVELLNDDCRIGECLLGSVITDAMRAETGAQIAITNGGGIRADIDTGEVTMGEILTVLPFGNLVATFELSGADIVASLESGVSRVGGDSGTGRFPQVSGLRYSFDASQEAGSRIISVEVLNANGEYEPIDPVATYTVASNDFMRRGGDEYVLFRDNAANVYDFGKPLDQVLAEYIVNNPVTAEGREPRITRLDEPAG